MPAAVMLEAALASVAVLSDGAAGAALTDVSISAPLLLASIAEHFLIDVTAGSADGKLEVCSVAGKGKKQVHCRGHAAHLALPQQGMTLLDFCTLLRIS